MVLITITIWDLWWAVAAVWGLRALLRCVAIWASAPLDADWRACAWRCQWELLAFAAAALALAASLHQALLPPPEFGRLWLAVLLALGCRGLLDLPPLLRTARRIPAGRLLAGLRWRRFLLRLRWRRLLRPLPRLASIAAPGRVATVLAWRGALRRRGNGRHRP